MQKFNLPTKFFYMDDVKSDASDDSVIYISSEKKTKVGNGSLTTQ